MWRRMNTHRVKRLSLILLVLFMGACSSQKKRDEEYFLQKRNSFLQSPLTPSAQRSPKLL